MTPAMPGVIWMFKQLDRAESHLILGLAERGFRQRVYMRPDAPVFVPLDHPLIEVRSMRVHSVYDRRMIRQLREDFSSGLFSVIYAADTKPLINVIWAAYGQSVSVIAYRGTVSFNRWDPLHWFAFRNPRVDRYVCVVKAVEKGLRAAGVPESKLTTIYKGHDPDWYQPGPRTMLKEVGIPDEAFVLGCAAALRPLKGVYEMLRSLPLVHSRQPVHVLLAGELRDPRIAELVKEEPYRSQVHLLGFRHDVQAWMGACDAFVMPTLRNEGLPKAVIEAMSMRVAPIVTRVGGMPELVENGVSGLVVEPGDERSMAEAIQRLANNPILRTRLAAAARRRIECAFHTRETVQAYAQLLRGIRPQ